MAGIGFDCGTFNLVKATRNKDNTVDCLREINAFIEVPLEDKFAFKMLKKAGVPLIERNKVAYAIGEQAVSIARSFGNIELRRPMHAGCVNPREKDGFSILATMIHSMIGEVSSDGEPLCYTIPANAINEETDVDYHQDVLKQIFSKYEINNKRVMPYPINEALALIYAELQNKFLTGIGVSCLRPGTKIYTNKGIVNIEDVKEGDEVITHKGRWRKITKVIKKEFSGWSTNLQLQGYSDNTNDYKFVDNHELYIQRNGEWDWVGCNDIEIGDIVGEPILRNDKILNKESVGFTLCERTTCSKEYKKKKINGTSDIQRLIGYFLGDGSICQQEGAIQFDFGINEQQYVDDVKEILLKSFNKQSTQYIKDVNCIRLKCYSVGLINWLSKNCYDDNQQKIYPWKINKLNRSQCLNLLIGLIRSDGSNKDSGITFYNTSTNLIILVKQLFSKLGFASSIHYRLPRSHALKDGRVIQGKLNEWSIQTGSKEAMLSLSTLIDSVNCSNSVVIEKIFIRGDYCCSRIQKIEKEFYTGTVYDLQVEEDHSFSGPFLTIHNCGAGMVNVCYANRSVPIVQFSLVNSGDWIDRQAAKAAAVSETVINREKEKINLLLDPKDEIERAIQTQYRILIRKTVKGIRDGLEEAGKSNWSTDPVDFIVAGGTASPIGFDKLIQEAIKEFDFPIQIGQIKRPKDNLFAVARGCLEAAECIGD